MLVTQFLLAFIYLVYAHGRLLATPNKITNENFLATIQRIASKTSASSNVPTDPILLPKDDGFLINQQVQWWYWTGHLTASKTSDPNVVLSLG